MSPSSKFEKYVQTIPDVVFELDNEGIFVFVSDAVEDFGYQPEELIGGSFRGILHPDDCDSVARMLVLPKYKGRATGSENAPKLFDERRTGSRMTRNLEVRIRLNGKKNEYRFVDIGSSGKWDKPVLNKTKKLLGSVGIIKDISKRKTFEEELKKTHESAKLLYKELERKTAKLEELNLLKSQFVANVSHEFKNPLSTIRESMAIVSDGTLGEINPKQKKILENGEKTANRLIRLVSDLLDISKIESGRIDIKRAQISVVSIIEEVLEIYSAKIAKKKIKVTKNISQDTGNIWADRDKISQVIINLLDNAVKYTPDNGRILIESSGAKEKAVFSMSNTSAPILEEYRNKIFDKFVRITAERDDGAGLGLAIVKDIVELHRGKIWLEIDKKNGWNKFIFELPRDLRK